MKVGHFQNIAIGIAIVILVVSVGAMGMVLAKTDGYPYPPTVDVCPDYWTTISSAELSSTCTESEYGCCSDHVTLKTDADGSNCAAKCFNTHKLGTTSANCPNIPMEMNFSGDEYTGANGSCNKKKWANNCGLTWDGITNMTGTCA
jgi:hypothetical protein